MVKKRGRKPKSETAKIEEEIVEKPSKPIVDVHLDFSQDPNIPENRFIDAYTKAFKKANPRCNAVVIQYYTEAKWREFKNDSTQNIRKRKSKTDAILKSKIPKLDEEAVKSIRAKKSNFISDSDGSDHNDVCEVCEKGGQLLLCDNCNAAYHTSCINLETKDVPDGDWFCPLCAEEQVTVKKVDKKPPKPKPEIKPEDEPCYNCGVPNTDSVCAHCLKSYHTQCIIPPNLASAAKLKCQFCSAKPPSHQIEKIIFWKTVKFEVNTGKGDKNNSYTVKKFLVKYVDYSFWEVEWIDEYQLRVHSQPMYIAFVRKNDFSRPMPFEDSDIIPDESDPLIDLDNITENDLHSTFYIYGIKPEWLQIQRIICYDKNQEEFKYCVKWRDLPHVNCTWESRKTKYLRDICDLKYHIKKFEMFIKEACKRPMLFPKNGLKSATYKAYRETPPFLSLNNDLTLHNYQLDGLNWIRYSCFNHTNVILADEMGLGKTIQSISFLYSLYKENICWGPFLVCAPLSTLPNWEREFEIWAPDLYVVVLSMTRENRDMIKNEEFYLGKCSSRIPRGCRKNFKFHVLLVSYEVVQIEAAALKHIKWSVLVLDEAHRIKNKQSKMHQILADYRFDFKLLLTGTPLQNNLEELFYLLNFLSPHDFKDSELFLSEFQDLNKEEQIAKIHKLLDKRLLRRIKSDVLKDVPSKSEMIIPVDLSPLQKKYYKAILNRNYTILIQKGNTATSLLNVLMDLKKCCNHPYLFNLPPEEQPTDEETGVHQYEPLVKSSAKMVLLEKMLSALKRNSHRVLIFSQMTRLLDLIEEMLSHNDWKYERIDGSVPTLSRQAAIDRFNAKDANSFVFLLSTRAGGLGINLASADTVIIYDSDWNPHNDIQALSRAHRMGQSKKVMIYRFITRNSVEERIMEVAKKKMMLTHLVVNSNVGKTENLTKRDLDDIIRFGSAQLFDSSDSQNALEYDDAAIAMLLDRQKAVDEATESGLNQYFSSFKIVDCAVKQPIEKEQNNLANISDSRQYWENILKFQHEEKQEMMFDEFGKGKRQRKKVNYMEHDKEGDVTDVDPDYDIESDSSTTSNESADTQVPDELSPQVKPPPPPIKLQPIKRETWKIPPLSTTSTSPRIVQMSSSTELKIKKMIINNLITFGLPSPDLSHCYEKWGLCLEPNFSVDDFKHALKNILLSLDYQSNKSKSVYDKFPLDESGSQSVLARISLIELIKSKVTHYVFYNPYLLPVCIDEYIIHPRDIPENYPACVAAFLPEHKDENVSQLSYHIKPPMTYHDLKSSSFKFNIEDFGYTELHVVWDSEHNIRDNSNIWWRYHDLWLLVGILVHGYNNFQAIFNDSRFSVLNSVFSSSNDDKTLFVRRRLDLIEQGLLIESVIFKTLDMRVYLRHQSGIVKMHNKIVELSNLIESCHSLVENLNQGRKEAQHPLANLCNYLLSLTGDIKNDASHLTRFIISSSLRTAQLFPRVDERFVNKNYIPPHPTLSSITPSYYPNPPKTN